MGIENCHISINRTSIIDNQKELNNERFLEFAQHQLIKDKYQCQLCGFQAVKLHQQVITRNGRYTNEDFNIDNLITVCPLCFLGHRLGHAALTDELTFMYCPELTQAEVNNLLRQMYFYQEMDTPEYDSYTTELPEEAKAVIELKECASTFIQDFRDRVGLVSEHYSYTSLTHLKTIASFLYDLPEDAYAQRGKFFKNIRYLINPRTMIKYNDIYKKTVFAHLNGFDEINKSKHMTSITSAMFRNEDGF